MAFGQPSGPPATARQLRELNALVERAGHTSFRDARGPLGLNQRQAGGRFTQDEAAELISRLESEGEASTDPGPAPSSPDPDRLGPSQSSARTARGINRPISATPVASPPAASRRQSLARQLEQVPEDLLVDELRRRGWTVTSP